MKKQNNNKRLFGKALLVLLLLEFLNVNIFADSFYKYVGETFFLPFPKLSISNAAIYDYNYEPTIHIDITNQKYGEAKISSIFEGTEFVTCNIYYYVQSPSGYRQYGRTVQSHRVSCRSNDITLSAPKNEININEGMQLTCQFAHITYGQSPQVTYTVSPYGCVSVSPSGYVKGLKAGTATIQAKSNLGDNVSTVTITVRKIEPSSITIYPYVASMFCDENLRMRAEVEPSNAPQEVTWILYNSSSSIAEINNNGVVRGVSPGEITVKAVAQNGIYALRKVTLKAPPLVKEATIPHNNATGQNVFVNPSVTFSHALYKGNNFGEIAFTDRSGSKLNGVVELSGRSLIFRPAKPLDANSVYNLIVPANAVKNKWGSSYGANETLTFTTGDLEKLILSTSVSSRFVKKGTSVKIMANQPNASIFYTLDGTTPTTNSKKYSAPIVINKDSELKAIAVLEGYKNSDILDKKFIISNVSVVGTYPNNENPLYVYSNVIPSMTFSNKIERSANASKISFQCVGEGEMKKQIVVCDSSIYIVPQKELTLGRVYKINIPANAIKTIQGEYNESVEWSFVTGNSTNKISVGEEQGLALKSDKSLLAWGAQSYKTSDIDGGYEYSIVESPAKLMSDVADISSGFMHSAALKTDGSLWMWGRQYCGEFGNNSTASSSVPVKVLDNGVRAVCTGGQTSAIIKDDNTLWMCGRNDFGQVGNGTVNTVKTFVKVMENVKSAVAGWGVSFAITSNNQLYGWGRNDRNQLLSKGTDYSLAPKLVMNGVAFVSASVTESDYFAAIKNNGNLVIWGKGIDVPKTIDKNVATVSVGKNYVEYVKEDGSIWAFGENNYGQLGTGTSEYQEQPIKIMGGGKVVQSTNETTFFIKENGSVWAWGRNNKNLLGQRDSYSEISFKPVKVIEGLKVGSLTGLDCYKNQIVMEQGSYGVVPVYPHPLIANYKEITWKSSNPKCVSVNENGVIFGVSSGMANITATIRDKQNKSFTKKCVVVISDPTGMVAPIISGKELKAWASNHYIYITGVDEGEQIDLVNVSGTVVDKCTSNGTINKMPCNISGTYIIRTKEAQIKVLCK